MSKILILGILIVFGLGLGGWLYFFQPRLPMAIFSAKKLPPPVHLLSDRAEKFSISSGEGYPIFIKELVADPFKVRAGEEQYFSIWAKDPEGIEKLTAAIKTDKEVKTFELQLAEGTEQEGRWQGSWLTENISLSDNYPTEFRAVNKNYQDRKSTFFWQILK